MFSSRNETPEVFLNAIETSVPNYEGHGKFVSLLPKLAGDERLGRLMTRMAAKCQIEKRYTVLKPASEAERMDQDGIYEFGAFASTGARMRVYREAALPLARKALDALFKKIDKHEITHLIVASCTGFYAPGLDLEIQSHYGLRSDLERTVIGFMGCYAGFNAMKSAWHIVRSQPEAKVLTVNLELCSLHLQETANPERIMGFLQFADGCAASVISARPEGLRLDSFRNEVFNEGSQLIGWQVGDSGFEMTLSIDVPQTLGKFLPEVFPRVLSGEERAKTRLWAVHPGGRSILDVVQQVLELSDVEMRPSRETLRDYGNMSSATILFVLKSILEDTAAGGPGLACAFGPGLTVETMRFSKNAPW